MMTDYWKNYWQQAEIIRKEHPQAQVGRTKNKQPISEDRWSATLDFIESLLKPKPGDVVLDLCSGNGLLATFFSLKCNKVTAVDFSTELLNKINTDKFSNIKKIQSDVLEIDLQANYFDKAILYFAMQHFSLKEAIILLRKVYYFLKPHGVFYIGDIPDEDKIWSYFNNREREQAHFNSILNDKPIIGQWFQRSFIEKAAIFSGFSNVNIIDQPDYQINAHYRFDALLEK